MAEESSKQNRQTANSSLSEQNLFGETSVAKPSGRLFSDVESTSSIPVLQTKDLDFPKKTDPQLEVDLEIDPVKLLEQKFGSDWKTIATPKEMEEAIQRSVQNEQTIKTSKRDVQIQNRDQSARQQRDERQARKDEIYRLEDQVARNERDDRQTRKDEIYRLEDQVARNKQETENQKRALEHVVEPKTEELLRIKYGENWRETAPAEDIYKAVNLGSGQKRDERQARKDEIYRLEDQVARNKRDDRQARKNEIYHLEDQVARNKRDERQAKKDETYRLEDQVARNKRDDEQRKSSLEVVSPEAEKLLEIKYGENWRDVAPAKDIQQATQMTASQKASSQRESRAQELAVAEREARKTRENTERKKQEERATARSNAQDKSEAPKPQTTPPSVSIVPESETKTPPPAQIVSTSSIGENLGNTNTPEQSSSSETYYMVGGVTNPETGKLEGGIRTDPTHTIALSGDPKEQEKVDQIRALREQMASTARAANNNGIQTDIPVAPKPSISAPTTTPTSGDGALYGKTPEGVPFRVDRGGKVTYNVEKPKEQKITIIPTTENNGLKLAQDSITQYQTNKSAIENEQVAKSVTSLSDIEENNENAQSNISDSKKMEIAAKSDAGNYFKSEPPRNYPNINEVTNNLLSIKTESPPIWRTSFG